MDLRVRESHAPVSRLLDRRSHDEASFRRAVEALGSLGLLGRARPAELLLTKSILSGRRGATPDERLVHRELRPPDTRWAWYGHEGTALAGFATLPVDWSG